MTIDRLQRNHGQFGEKSRFSLYEVWAIEIYAVDRKFTNQSLTLAALFYGVTYRWIDSGALSCGVIHPTPISLL